MKDEIKKLRLLAQKTKNVDLKKSIEEKIKKLEHDNSRVNKK
jgi:hypothetical protein